MPVQFLIKLKIFFIGNKELPGASAFSLLTAYLFLSSEYFQNSYLAIRNSFTSVH